MKRIYIFIASVISLIAMSLPTSAYETTVREDRVWHYSCWERDKMGNKTVEVNSFLRFKGTKTVDSKLYHVLLMNDTDTAALMRQEDRKVYVYNGYNTKVSLRPQEEGLNESLIYDFGAEEHQTFWMFWEYEHNVTPAVVRKKETLDIRGNLLSAQLLIFKYNLENWIIEGVGPMIGSLFSPGIAQTPYNGIPWTEEDISFVKLTDLDGNILFEASDFPKLVLAKITEVTEDSETVDSRMYDLMGREIKEPALGTVYIQGGRKLIAR